MKTHILILLLAPLWGGALTAELNGQGALSGAGGETPLTGDKAVEHLKRNGQYDSLSAAIAGARYRVKTNPTRESAATAANPAHGLVGTFTPDGLRLEIRAGSSADVAVHTVTWTLESLGYGAEQIPVPAGRLEMSGQRVELIRGEPVPRSAYRIPRLTEWFQNTLAGLEHGFTLAERPSANPPAEPLRLVIAVTGDLTPHADPMGQNLALLDPAGRTVLSYAGLKVWDATGSELPARMQTSEDRVTLTVNDATACYPLTIDPTFVQQAYLKAHNSEANDEFGTSVAISGDTAVIGAPFESGSAAGITGSGSNNDAQWSGAAYVFVRRGTTWFQQAYLKASNADAFDFFGASVAVSGDTVVVGAREEDSNAIGVNGDGANNRLTNSGAAYVFVRNGENWTQQAYLKAHNAGPFDGFGHSAAISGDTVVVGARNSGAAYVFVRSGINWSQQAYLKASNADGGDLFGSSVAVSANTVVVGAPFEDSNATGINGDGNNNSAADSGAAYVFVRSGTTWSQQAYLKASNTEADDRFGSAVAVSGDTVVVGAASEDSNATGVNGDQINNSAVGAGAAYVFMRSALTGFWSQRAYLKASNAEASDEFGSFVAVSGNRVVVGAPNEDSSAAGVNGNGGNNSVGDSGAAYVFVRGGTIQNPTWSFRDYLKASNPGADDFFGSAVAVSGGTVVVGAPGEQSSAFTVNGNTADNSADEAGAVYIFEQTAAEIVVEQPLNTSLTNGASRDFIVIGANNSSLSCTIKNIGNDLLTGLAITIDGTDAAMFTVVTNPVAPLAPGGSTAFTVRFAPIDSAPRTATLHVASNDPDENPFDIILNGFTLTFTQDTDGDGLSDATEFLLAALGFDWKVSQPALVNNLFANANAAGLFTQSQLQALNVDTPLLSKNPNTGLFKLTIGVQKATLLTNFVAFPMDAPQTTINGQGKLEFQFGAPNNAAFFRLESR